VFGSHAVASSSSAASRLRLRTEPVSNAFWGEVQERRHPRVQDFAIFRLRRQQMLVVDQPRLFFDPLVPAIFTDAFQDERAPLTRQWRLLESRLALAAALADEFLGHAGSLRPDDIGGFGALPISLHLRAQPARRQRLAAGETQVDWLDVREVAPLDDALFDEA